MPSDRASSFVDFVANTARSNRRCRADLRSGLGRPVDDASRMHKYLAKFTAPTSAHGKAVLYTVASLIAYEPDNADPNRSPGSLGASMAHAGNTKISVNTLETTVHMLTRQPTGQLCRALTRAVLPLRDVDVAVDFARLIDDATAWHNYRRRIGARWLQDYYRTRFRLDTPDDPADPDPVDTDA